MAGIEFNPYAQSISPYTSSFNPYATSDSGLPDFVTAATDARKLDPLVTASNSPTTNPNQPIDVFEQSRSNITKSFENIDYSSIEELQKLEAQIKEKRDAINKNNNTDEKDKLETELDELLELYQSTESDIFGNNILRQEAKDDKSIPNFYTNLSQDEFKNISALSEQIEEKNSNDVSELDYLCDQINTLKANIDSTQDSCEKVFLQDELDTLQKQQKKFTDKINQNNLKIKNYFTMAIKDTRNISIKSYEKTTKENEQTKNALTNIKNAFFNADGSLIINPNFNHVGLKLYFEGTELDFNQTSFKLQEIYNYCRDNNLTAKDVSAQAQALSTEFINSENIEQNKLIVAFIMSAIVGSETSGIEKVAPNFVREIRNKNDGFEYLTQKCQDLYNEELKSLVESNNVVASLEKIKNSNIPTTDKKYLYEYTCQKLIRNILDKNDTDKLSDIISKLKTLSKEYPEITLGNLIGNVKRFYSSDDITKKQKAILENDKLNLKDRLSVIRMLSDNVDFTLSKIENLNETELNDLRRIIGTHGQKPYCLYNMEQKAKDIAILLIRNDLLVFKDRTFTYASVSVTPSHDVQKEIVIASIEKNKDVYEQAKLHDNVIYIFDTEMKKNTTHIKTLLTSTDDEAKVNALDAMSDDQVVYWLLQDGRIAQIMEKAFDGVDDKDFIIALIKRINAISDNYGCNVYLIPDTEKDEIWVSPYYESVPSEEDEDSFYDVFDDGEWQPSIDSMMFVLNKIKKNFPYHQ